MTLRTLTVIWMSSNPFIRLVVRRRIRVPIAWRYAGWNELGNPSDNVPSELTAQPRWNEVLRVSEAGSALSLGSEIHAVSSASYMKMGCDVMVAAVSENSG